MTKGVEEPSFKKIIFCFFAVLGLCCFAGALSSCSEQGLLFVVELTPLTAVAPLAVQHRLQACGLQ